MKVHMKKSDKLWETSTLIQIARDQYDVGSDEYLLLNEICKKFNDKYLDQFIKETKNETTK